MALLTKQTLIKLYSKGMSLTGISNHLHCSIHKVTYWMRKYGIPRRSRSDAVYIQANPQGNPFHIHYPQTPSKYVLYGLGLGIYWGEGTKGINYPVRVTNSDPCIIRTFRMFLLSICHVDLTRIRYSIVAFNDSNIHTVQSYWSKQLKISPDKFGKIVQIPTQGKGTYRKKSQFGVCSITVGNTKLKIWIMDELKKYEARVVYR